MKADVGIFYRKNFEGRKLELEARKAKSESRLARPGQLDRFGGAFILIGPSAWQTAPHSLDLGTDLHIHVSTA